MEVNFFNKKKELQGELLSLKSPEIRDIFSLIFFFKN